MSDIRRLLNQSSHYLVGHLFVMAAGFISFPILTRVLSVSDYGIMGLISVTLFIVQAAAKLGAPNSNVRFYAESKSENNLLQLYSTIFYGYGILALVISLLFFLFTQLLSGGILDTRISNLLSLVSVLIFLNSMILLVESSLRAEQRTGLYNFIMVINRYGSLGVGLLFLLAIIRNLYGYYIGQIIVASIICLVLMNFIVKQKVRIRAFSLHFFKKTLKFGTPLTWSELGHLTLSYSDRYLIQHYLGPSSLGLYTAGHNLTTYIIDVVMYPINYAIDPIYLNLVANKKEEEARVFLSKSLRYFILIVAPIVVGTIATSHDLIALLASKKYIDANTIIPYIIIGNSIYACQVILNAGLFIRQKTHILMIIKFVSCALNLGLNMVLIPRYGIIGAAQATLFSHMFYTVVITYYSFKEFSFRIEYEKIAKYVLASVLMYGVIKQINLDGHLANIIVNVMAGIIIYPILVIIFDREIRFYLLTYLQKLK